jgi:hypothetical protein
MQRIFVNKCFLIMVGSVCCVKRLRSGSKNSLKDVKKSQMMPDQVWNCLRQQSKDLYVEGFDALVKRWDMCINVGGGYFEKYMFFPVSNITCFTFYVHL